MKVSRLIDMTVSDFCKGLASGEATPGGGAASALAVANGAALVQMYCQFTIGREKYAEAEPEFQKALKEIQRIRLQLIHLVDADAAAYGKVLDAFKLPKGTDEEKAARSESIQFATVGAIEVPLKVSEYAVVLLAIASRIHETGNQVALSDAGVGVQLILAGFAGAVLNVYINLGSIKDEAYVVAIKKTVHELEDKARSVSAQVAGSIFSRLKVQ
jgi:methenyltetrahydrofolate cyclohydrolase